jgi:ankyrin repeat protein
VAERAAAAERRASVRKGAKLPNALHVCCRSGFAEGAKMLLKAGWAADAREGGRTPLFAAAAGGHAQIVLLLLKAVSDRSMLAS